MWQDVGCLMIGCGGYHSVCWVRRAEVSGGMDNDHSQKCRVTQCIWGVPYIQPLCARQGLGLWSETVLSSSVSSTAATKH